MLSDERARAGIDAKLLALHGSSAAGCLHRLAARRHYDLLVAGAATAAPPDAWSPATTRASR
jgi:nucleotide-binding universal stress UspA family protein